MIHFIHRVTLSFALTFAVFGLEAQVSYIPIQFRTVSGIRPFVPVSLNGKPYLFMVHSETDFYVMTNHANASSAGARNLVKTSSFGINSPGHVDNRGRAETTIGELLVGSSRARDVPLSIFETMQDPPMDGMLGVKWLQQQKAMIDFDNYRLGTSTSIADNAEEDKHLVASGFIGHHMTRGNDGGYLVEGTVNGHRGSFRVSTVGYNVIDTTFAASAKIATGPIVDSFEGPKGAQGSVYLSKSQVFIAIEGQPTAPAQPLMWDLAAYGSGKIKIRESVTLGADFMLANHAVIDFGTATLFLPRM